MSSFYVTGGNLKLDAPSYVERLADTELYQHLKAGEFCYILTSRQMGKSSVMVRVADRLRQEGAYVSAIELSGVGINVDVEQWYYGIILTLGVQLDLEYELEDFYEEHQELGPFQRFTEAIRNVVLPKCQNQQIIIFIDEIDTVRSLSFSTDEFFAGIRSFYNSRSLEPELNRLTFCLIGVATPSDLIQDVRITPFNIGKRIVLEDLTVDEAAPLKNGLNRDAVEAEKLFRRIYHWTNGHPYLTQRLCKEVADDSAIKTPSDIDKLCHNIFLSTRSRESDTNLVFVRDRLLRGDHDRAAVLDLYQKVHSHKRVVDDDTNPLISILRLSGITSVADGFLKVHNHIYYQAFNRQWIESNMPDAEKRRQKEAFRKGIIQTAVYAVIIIAIIISGIIFYLDGYVWQRESYYNNYAKRYGVMEGVGKLSDKQVKGRVVSYGWCGIKFFFKIQIVKNLT